MRKPQCMRTFCLQQQKPPKTHQTHTQQTMLIYSHSCSVCSQCEQCSNSLSTLVAGGVNGGWWPRFATIDHCITQMRELWIPLFFFFLFFIVQKFVSPFLTIYNYVNFLIFKSIFHFHFLLLLPISSFSLFFFFHHCPFSLKIY